MTTSLRRALIAASAALAALVLSGAAAPAAPAAAAACPNGYVALTFDDGPSDTTPQLLAALTSNHLRATFFDQGNRALAHPEHVRAEVAAGMWIGNHSFSHANLPALPGSGSFEEIASTQWTLRNITGREPKVFRPPYGLTDARVQWDEQRIGVREVLWTVDSSDYAGATAEQIAAAARKLQPGGIILMHDWPPATIEAIPLIARDLAARGLCTGHV